MSETKLLCPKEAAKIIGVSEGTLAVWRCTKKYPIPFVKIGTRVRYKSDDINRWIDSCYRGQGAN